MRREFSAGGVVVRRGSDGTWVAAIRPQGKPEGHWVLPKGALGSQMLRKLKVYSGPDHPHSAQQPAPLDLSDARYVPA